MWDWCSGYGGNLILGAGGAQALQGDPFFWLFSLLCPSKYSELGFKLMIVFKFYLFGLSFSIYSKSKGYSDASSLCGSIVYTFSASTYVMFYATNILNPMWIFPLIILGVERIWNREKPWIFILSIALCFLNTPYFGYQMSLFVVVYCVIYYLTEYKGQYCIRTLLYWFFRFLIFAIIGVGLSMISSLPVIVNLLSYRRSYYVPLLFEESYYRDLISGFIGAFNMLGRDCNIGFSSVVVPCICLVFVRWKRYKRLIISIVLSVIVLFVPFFQSLVMGINYPNNRWIWCLCFIVSVIVTVALENFQTATVREKIYIGIGTFSYCFLSISTLVSYDPLIVTQVIFALFLSVLLCLSDKSTKRIYSIVSIILISLSVILPAYFYYHKDYRNMTRENLDKNNAYQTILNSGGTILINSIDKTQGYRYDSRSGRIVNQSRIFGVGGFDFYASYYNPRIDEFHYGLGLNTSAVSFKYNGLDRRSDLEYLLGSKYYIVPENSTMLLPVGFDNLFIEDSVVIPILRRNNIGVYYDEEEISYDVYENPDAIPLCLGYYSSISDDEYELLSPYERQQALMHTCVVEDENNIYNEINDITMPNDQVNYTLSFEGNVEGDLTGFYVYEDNARVVLNLERSIECSEIYIYFDNLNYDDDNNIQTGISLIARNDGVLVDYLSDSFGYTTVKSHMYGNKHNWMPCLGYALNPINQIEITFIKAGYYSMDNLLVYAEPYSTIRNNMAGVSRITDEVNIDGDSLYTHVLLDREGLVFFSIPYDKGWTAVVNGHEAEIILADKAFMAIKLDAGEYDIELHYSPIYYRYGFIFSSFSLMVLVVYYVYDRRKEMNLSIITKI